MTLPPIDPGNRPALGDAAPTEPVPQALPVQVPAPVSPLMPPPPAYLAGASPAGVPGAGPQLTPGFMSAPGFTPAQTAPVPGAEPVGPQSAPQARSASGSSRILTFALGIVFLVGAIGIAFAAGRASAPAPAATTAAALGRQGGGFPGNGGGIPGAGGNAPGASLDPNGRGTGPGGNGFPGGNGGGVARLGVGGLTVTGTVQSVTPDSITITTTAGRTITVGLDSSTTYHQQASAQASDVQAGKTVKLQLAGGVRPNAGTGGGNGGGGGTGGLTLGTAGDVTIVP